MTIDKSKWLHGANDRFKIRPSDRRVDIVGEARGDRAPLIHMQKCRHAADQAVLDSCLRQSRREALHNLEELFHECYRAKQA